MEAAFETLDLWESHIIGELPEKIERDYKLKEFKARGILQATVSSKFKFMLCDSNGVQLDARKIWVGLKNHYVDYCKRSLTRSEEAMANLQYDPRKGVEELYNTMTSLRHKIAAANIFWGEKVFASRVMAKLVSKSREWRYFEGHTVRWTDEMLSPNKFLSELIEEEIKLINMGALPRHGVDDTIYEANYASRNHRNLRKGSTSHGPNAHGAKQGNSSRDDYFAANHEMDNYYRRDQGRRPYEQRNDDQDRMPACHNCGNIGHYAKDCRPAPRNDNYRQQSPKFFSKGPRSNNQDRSRNNQSADGMFVAMDNKKRDIVIDEACSSIDRSDMFILDSGASSHMVCRPEWVYDFVPCSNRQVKASGQDMHNVIGTGTVEILCNVGHRTVSIQLGNVLVVPTFGVNLISENILEDKGCRISIFKKVRTIRKSNGEVIMTTRRDGGVNAVNCEAIISDEERAMAHATVIATANHASEVFRKPTDTAGWHKRLGHINVEAIKNLADKSEGLDIIPGKTKERSQCVACIEGKAVRHPFPKRSTHVATQVNVLLHMDLEGPFHDTALGGYKYYLIIVDDYSRYSHLYPMISKDQTFQRFKEHVAAVELSKGLPVRAIRTDNGGEFTSSAFQQFLKLKGIEVQRTTPYTPQQNGVAERKNRTIVSAVRAMFAGCKLGREFWAEAAMTAVYLQNRSPNKALGQRTPYELWTGELPKVMHLRTFGCAAYALRPKQLLTKLDTRTRRCIFIGYHSQAKAYKLFDLESKKMITSRDVDFAEEEFPSLSNPVRRNNVVPVMTLYEGAPLFTHSYNLGGVTPSVPIAIDNVVSPKTPETPGNPDCASTPIGGESEPGRRQVPRVVPTARNTAKMTVADRGTEVTTSDERITQEELLGRGISRNKAIKTSLNESSLAGYRKPNQKPRSKSQGSRKAVQERPVDVMNRDRATMAAPTESTVTADYPGAISETADASEPSIQAAVEQRMVEDLPTNTSQDDSDLEESDQYYSYTHGSGTSNADESNNAVAVISNGSSRNIVPETWQQAMMSSDADLWKEAADAEMDSLYKNNTWQECALPSGFKAIKVRWVFKIKYKADGTIDKYKARLVAKGFAQVPGIDFHETYAPVLKFTSLRIILALAAIYDWEVDHTDANNAFLNGTIDEELYIELPEGYNNSTGGAIKRVGRLQKALYGLRQAPYQWNKVLVDKCLNMGFTQCMTDKCILILSAKDRFVMIAIYVDDILFVGNNRSLLERMKSKLFKEFSMKDLGPIHTCLNIRIIRNRMGRTITLSQSHYLSDVLEKFRMSNCNPKFIPLYPSNPLPAAEETDPVTSAPYREAVGSLMYAMIATRPDLAAAVGQAARHMHHATDQHWNAVKLILHYVQGTLSYALELGGTNASLSGYSDADWAGDVKTRKSTSGYLCYVGNALVSWRSSKQTCVAVSTMEAEYTAAESASRELLFLRDLLGELGFEQDGPTTLYCDSQSAISNMIGPSVVHEATKHIGIKINALRDRISQGLIKPEYIGTKDQVADILTKGLPRPAFEQFVNLLGLRECSRRGGVLDIGNV
ncbi:hypothetical protein QVD99_8718 [Batrachochytrium dendrobatidis]|nr:hypothetical protein QVD99_8718 [Batrachochytrium dendrobatidis]